MYLFVISTYYECIYGEIRLSSPSTHIYNRSHWEHNLQSKPENHYCQIDRFLALEFTAFENNCSYFSLFIVVLDKYDI